MICDSPFFVMPKAGTEKVPVPCGRCPPCKKRRVDSWVFRLLQEDKSSGFGLFITLTYDTRFVPISDNGFMTLRKSDFQNFMKRLRKIVPRGTILKYFAVGEYGTQNMRPHFHAILFGLEDSSLVAKAWSLDGVMLGQVHVGKVSGDSIAYCMKYIDKPNFSKKHSRDDRVKEFSLMSKGLGASYLSNEVVAYHKADLSRMYVTKPGGHKVALPRYYRGKIYTPLEQNQQVALVADQVIEQDKNDRREYAISGYSETFTFEQWKESKKYQRYKSFYSRLKQRNL